MSVAVINDLTPTRKRKRDSEKLETNKCFTNAAFSSTPKKISGRRRIISSLLKENQRPFNNNSCMEVKSIAELVNGQKETALSTICNSYEVQRKPPKKKKREAAIEQACFENPALNLNLPEKPFNPFEVVRATDEDQRKCQEDQQKCFVNEALNIKSQDSKLCVRNPFEISRNDDVTETRTTKESTGIENLALEDIAGSTRLKIGIPFIPTVNCRIDFNNVSLSQLTPSKLLLSEKLVFSPVPNAVVKPKRSLDAISEESSSTSIGKELDRYQLELENSINEAKLTKRDEKHGKESIFEDERVYQLQLKTENRRSLNQRLTEIPESDEYEIEENGKEIAVRTLPDSDFKNRQTQVETKVTKITTTTVETVATVMSIENAENTEANEAKQPIQAECDFYSEEEEDLDFKAPTPFVRSYRRDIAPKIHLTNSKESLNSKNSAKISEVIAEKKNHTSVKNLIRKSIRKIIPQNKEQPEYQAPKSALQPTTDNKEDDTKQCTLASHIMSSIRHSLRKKPKAALSGLDKAETAIPLAEVSIIDASERKMKLKSFASRNDYARIEELTNEKKHLLRNGSLRRSMMKTIFHKQEEYSFKK